jgi:neutral trehalase
MVISKAKQLRNKILSQNKSSGISVESVQPAREYIEKYWKNLTSVNHKDTDSLIGLPHPFLVPAYEEGHEFDFNELYYWDSYFMVQGMLEDPHRNRERRIPEGMAGNYKTKCASGL